VKKYILYIILNLFFFLVTLYCLLYINTYLIELLIPHISGVLRIGLVLIETFLFTAFFYFINKLILRYDYQSTNQKSIALKTSFISSGIIIAFIIYAIIYTLCTK